MIKNLSLVASGLLLSSSLALATEVKTEGSITSYTYTGDSATYTTLTASASAEAEFTKEVSGKIAAFAGTVLAGSEGNDEFDDTAVLTEANITYKTDKFAITAGRVAVDLEWAGDYHEAVVVSTSAVENTEIVAFYANGTTAAPDVDGITDFDEAVDGAAGLDIKYTGTKDLELNVYGYSVTDVASYYGLKATYTGDIGFMGHVAMTSEDAANTEDGTLLALEVSSKVSDVDVAAGYIMTGEDNGIGSMATLGDNYSPFDDGSNLGGADSSAAYLTASTSVSGVDLGLLAGKISYGDSSDTEIDLTADYEYNDNLSVGVVAAKVSGDYEDKYANLTVSYSF